MKKNITYKLFFVVCIQGLLGLQHAYAATYYVSPTGSDSNNGTALSTPVKTINQALSKAQSSGDIVYVMTGTYSEEVSIEQSGITLSAYLDNKPVIDGGNALPGRDWGNLISVAGNNNTISGFEVKNSNINGAHIGGYGIQVWGHHNTVSKMDVHHIWEQGIVINGDYNILEDSTVRQAAFRNSINPGSAGGGWGMGITAARNDSSSALKPGITSYAILRRNTVFNNWGEGISCFAADHCTLEDNIVYDNWATNLYLSDATNSLVQRNLIYISSAPAIPSSARIGILLADEIASVPRSANNTVINNFIYNADLEGFYWSDVAGAGLKSVLIANNTIVDGGLLTGDEGGNIVNTNSQIRNNIILGKNNNVSSNSGITFSNNNWSVTPSAAAAATNIVGDPRIARTGTTAPGALTSAYFKISGSSPVTDAAMPLNRVTNDFFKGGRGTAPDIGAHEFGASNTISNTSNNNTADSTAPSAPSGLGATASSATQVNLTWNASTDNVSVAGYKVYRDGTEIGTNAATSFTDASVAGGTTYSYTIKAYDAAGNFSASSNTATVNTSQATSTVNISSYSVENITASSADINWTTNIPSTGVVSYGTSADNLGSQASVGNQATSQSVQISGLNSGTVYYYKITVNNGSKAAVSSFSTASSSRRWSRRG